MAWIEQTKKGSSKSGGPQYYLQGLSDTAQATLAGFKKRPVRIWTPYGVVDSGLVAVSHGVGAVGHDRVQSGGKVPSVADQIAHWFNLPRADIERIEFDDSFDRDCFVIRPSKVKFFSRTQVKTVVPDTHPLTITSSHRSPTIVDQVRLVTRADPDRKAWIASQLSELVAEHQQSKTDVDERDLLRISGALDMLGVKLGVYRLKGIDCASATFRFDGFPEYPCPVEIEEKSSGFLAPHHAAHRKQRAVLLCMAHDRPEVLKDYIDVIELRELDRIMKSVA